MTSWKQCFLACCINKITQSGVDESRFGTVRTVELNDRGPRVKERRTGKGESTGVNNVDTDRHKGIDRNCATRFNFIEKKSHQIRFPQAP